MKELLENQTLPREIKTAQKRVTTLGYPLSVQESLDDREMEQKIALIDSLRKGSVKILEDGSGDGFFLDVVPAV